MMKKPFFYVYLCLIITSFVSCMKDPLDNQSPVGARPSTVDSTSIVGKWTAISDSVAIQGNYTINGGIPVTGLIPMGPDDYFQFDADGQFHEKWNGMLYPYPCTYNLRIDSVLITNNVYAPLDSAKVRVTAHTLRIVGMHSSPTGSIVSIFSLKR